LYFAQVREDPVLEIEALEAGAEDTIVVVSSGGCTALSLLAAGAGTVVAVDLNPAQNHLVELKAAAVSRLARAEAIAFLGGSAESAAGRMRGYGRLRSDLSAEARGYWDARSREIERGVLTGGVTERFIGTIVTAMRTTIHPPSRILRLLDCQSLDAQRAFYDQEWNNRRWRLMFKVLLNRRVFRRTYDPAFFAHVENPSFPDHFHQTFEHGLTNIAIANNYFLHHMLTGSYPRDIDGGLPPYLAGVAAERMAGLRLVDGGYLDYLRTCADACVDGFALSNICEWLQPAQVDELMGEIVRVARPGARLVFRNFVGWTDVPPRWRDVIAEDRERGERLIQRDRSMMQRRFAVCRIRTEHR
jgi:S-adenosylmethionine-diacylglycerol 3-amino-3-carboxypropyl transferase